MIEWQDEGLVLGVRPHGETGALLDAFTRARGRHAGVVPGGASRRMRPHLQPGVLLALVWRARTEDRLGQYRAEPLRNRAALALDDRLALAGIGAVCALLAAVLPERAPHPALWERTEALLDLLAGDRDLWTLAYLRWEQALLDEMGFGLDLAACAVTGAREGLAHVSPRTGRAVSREGAGGWAGRLLPLPPVLRGEGEAGAADIVAALGVTGHFIARRLMPEGRDLPAARDRLVALIGR
jgi:DNA repair protein RecO (recombination protein O)